MRYVYTDSASPARGPRTQVYPCKISYTLPGKGEHDVMSLERDAQKIIQPSSVENVAPTDEQKGLRQTPQTIMGQITELLHAVTAGDDSSRQFLLRVVQPGLAGLMDGS